MFPGKMSDKQALKDHHDRPPSERCIEHTLQWGSKHGDLSDVILPLWLCFDYFQDMEMPEEQLG